MSALYAISQSRKFQKPVKAELQHCLFLENEAQTKRLHFIKAYQTQPGMPYLFKLEEGGEFPLENRYASLWHSEFCIFGIVRETPGPVSVSDSEETNGSHHSTDEDDNVESTNGHETPDEDTNITHHSTDDEDSGEGVGVVNIKSTTGEQTNQIPSHEQNEESRTTRMETHPPPIPPPSQDDTQTSDTTSK